MDSRRAVGLAHQRPSNEGKVQMVSSFQGCNPNLQLDSQRRRWESNPLETALQAVAVPSGSSVRLHQVSSPGIEPGLRPSQSRVRIRHTPRTYICCHRSAPCRGIEPRLAVSKTAVLVRHTRKAISIAVSRPGIEPGPATFGGCRCDPLHHRDIHARADDWIRTSINRFTRPAPFSVEPRRHISISTSARSRTPSGSFGGWLLSQEHTRVKPRAGEASPGADHHSTFQLHVPVRLADELRPAFDPHSVGRVERLPRRADRRPCGASCRPAAACGRPCACCTPRTPARSSPRSRCRLATAE